MTSSAPLPPPPVWVDGQPEDLIPSKRRRATHATTARIDSLDLIRGIALLGILIMNSISFALPGSAYIVLSEGSNNPIDWAIGLAAAVFIDEKMMAIFSLLFGVGIVVFAERAKVNGRRPTMLSLWRFALLLGFGLLHTALWDGDVLVLYALCAPVVLLLRRLGPSVLAGLGLVTALSSVILGVIVQQTSPVPLAVLRAGLEGADDFSPSGRFGLLFLVNGFGRALGLMLIGVALFKWNVVQGQRSALFYRRMVRWGFGLGLPLATLGTVLFYQSDYAPERFLVSRGLLTMATVPLALAYVGLICRWSNRPNGKAQDRLRAVGRMAMTNYLTQTFLGLGVFSVLFPDADPARSIIAGFVVAVWAIQLLWSTWWLERFRFGPFEWLWRCCTYRELQPLRAK